MSERLAREYVATYLRLQREMAVLKAVAEETRAAVVEALHADGAAPGHTWEFEGVGVITVVKGRESEKISRRALIAAGVDPRVVDEATTVTVGRPSMRINAWGDDE